MESINERIIKESFDINFFSHQKISQKIVNIMKIQEMGGSIMFNISKQAVNPGKNFGPYGLAKTCLLYTSPSPRDKRQSRMPSSA